VPILDRPNTIEETAREIKRLQPHIDAIHGGMLGLSLSDRALILGCVVGGIAMAADEETDVGIGRVFVNAVYKIAQSWSVVK
jgi:hypothetical protein